MSGHSKWSSIKHKKGAADAKRGKLFSKLSRAIIVAAKEGGGDPANNLSLQNAIEKAKSYSMPKDNIDRAIAKGSGADADADAFETIVYEGYGPEGVAVIVEALTDNRNRTAADVRHMFAKHGGNLGATGAVAWQFERRGVVVVPADGRRRGGAAARRCRRRCGRRRAGRRRLPGHIRAGGARGGARRRSRRPGFTVDSAELMLVPKTTVAVEDEAKARQVMRLIDALEDNDDVQDVYANFDIPEQVLEARRRLASCVPPRSRFRRSGIERGSKSTEVQACRDSTVGPQPWHIRETRRGARPMRAAAGTPVSRVIGLVAKGLSFGLVGALAVKLALGDGGKATSRQGALQ